MREDSLGKQSRRKGIIQPFRIFYSLAQHQAITAQCPSLTQQRREVLPHPDALESLSTDQASIHVEFIPGAKNRSNDRETVNLSNGYQKAQGPKMHRQDDNYLPESAVS
jgi:hypothetical protein